MCDQFLITCRPNFTVVWWLIVETFLSLIWSLLYVLVIDFDVSVFVGHHNKELTYLLTYNMEEEEGCIADRPRISSLARSAKLPKGLYILPSVIFSFFILFNDFSETNYLRISWTDFRNLFTEWKRFGCRWSIWTSFLISQGTLPWQPILGKICEMTFIQHSGILKRNALSSCGCAH